MKKFISLVLAVAMIISLVPTFAMASEEEPQTSNIITLFDFGSIAALSAADYNKDAAVPSALAYEGKESSLCWEMDITSSAEGYVSNAPELDFEYSASDLSAYSDEATINVRFYSENTGSKFNIVYFGSEGIGWRDTDDDGVNDKLVSYNEAVQIAGGWQVHSIPVKTLIERFGNYNLDNIINVRFNDDGWSNLKNNGYNDGDKVYIDEVWVDTNPDSYYDNLGSNTKLLWTADSEDGLNVSTDTQRNLYKEYTKSNLNFAFATLNDTTSFKDTDYSYVNMWIYSEKPQNDGMYFTLEGSFTKDGGTGTVIRFPIKHLDWSGWKLVSFNIANDRDSADANLSGTVSKLRFDVGKWNNLSTVNKAGGSITFGLDGVWLSNTSAQAEYEEGLSYGNKGAFNTNEIFVKDFNTKSSIIRSVTSYNVTGDLNASYNPYNSRLYDMSARLSFNSVTYNDILNLSTRVAAGKMASLQIKDRSPKTSDSGYARNPKIEVDQNSYVNAWIYNPAPKYTFDGTTPAEFLIVLGHRGDGTSNVTYHAVAVAADWSGWKLVSIPVTKWNNVYKTYGIYQMYISCNMDRYPRNSDGKVQIIERTDAEKTAGYASLGKVDNGTNHNVFARKYTVEMADGVISSATNSVNANYYNYIDVERVWVSNGAPKGAGTVISADNSALKCSADGNEINLFSTENTLAKSDISVIKTTNDAVSKVNATINNGVITLPEFTYGAKYSVYVNMSGTDATVNGKEFTFATEDIHVSDITAEDTKVSVTMHGNLGSYATANIIAAVYTSDSFNELEHAYVGNTQNGKAEVEIPAGTDLSKVRFFLFDNMETITPLEVNIQK